MRWRPRSRPRSFVPNSRCRGYHDRRQRDPRGEGTTAAVTSSPAGSSARVVADGCADSQAVERAREAAQPTRNHASLKRATQARAATDARAWVAILDLRAFALRQVT